MTTSPDTYLINATPLSGGATTAVATTGAPVVALIGFGGTLYWMETDPSSGNSTIRSLAGAGASINTVASGFASYGPTFAVDSSAVYYNSAPDLALNAQPLAGGAAVVLSSPVRATKLVAAGGNVVWADLNSVQTIPTSGGATSTLATFSPMGSVNELVFDGTQVYWSQSVAGPTISSVPQAGGGISTVYQGGLVDHLTLDASSRLNWREDFGSNFGSGCGRIGRLPVSSGPAETVVAGVSSPGLLLATASGLLVADLSCVKLIPLAGGMPSIVAAGQSTIAGLNADDTSVYWVNASGSVNKAPISGGAVTPLTSAGAASALPPAPGTMRLAPNGNLYWVADSQTVLGAPAATPSLNPTVIAQGLTGVTDLAVGATSVYISDQSAILKASLDGSSAPTTLIDGAASHLTLDGATLYWTGLGGSTLGGGAIKRAGVNGSSASELIEFDNGGGAGPFALDSTSVYFIESGVPNVSVPDIRKTPK